MSRGAAESLADGDEHARQLVETYCLYDEAHYWVPADEFKKMDLVDFLNHSDRLSVRSVDGGAWFEALVDIPPGEGAVCGLRGDCGG